MVGSMIVDFKLSLSAKKGRWLIASEIEFVLIVDVFNLFHFNRFIVFFVIHVVPRTVRREYNCRFVKNKKLH